MKSITLLSLLLNLETIPSQQSNPGDQASPHEDRSKTTAWTPVSDVVEDENEYAIILELPGEEKERH